MLYSARVTKFGDWGAMKYEFVWGLDKILKLYNICYHIISSLDNIT